MRSVVVINTNGLEGVVDPNEVMDIGSGPMFKVQYESLPIGIWSRADALRFPTHRNRDLSAATLCRLNGWLPGTHLEGTEGDLTNRGWSQTEVIEITAIGDERILARRVLQNGQSAPLDEAMWTLAFRDWKRVG